MFTAKSYTGIKAFVWLVSGIMMNVLYFLFIFLGGAVIYTVFGGVSL